MRQGKLIALLFTILFLAVAVFCGLRSPSEAVWSASVTPAQGLSVTVGEESLSVWKNEEGAYYLFLPGYARPEQLVFHLKENTVVRIAGHSLSDGAVLSGLETDVAYDFQYRDETEAVQSQLTVVKSENIPTLFMDVRSGDMTFIHRLKGNAESGSLRLYRPDGSLSCSGSLKAIEGRGNSTWDQEKKPYALELSVETDLLGMGAAQNWLLLANAFDPSNIRNQMVFDYSRAAGLAFTPDSRWVDLYLNGEYAGLYLLCEKLELHPRRIDVPQQDGFLVSIEKADRMAEQNAPCVTTASGVPLRVRQYTGSFEELQQRWQSTENAILAEDSFDAITGKHWTELVDLDSWVRKYLVEEIFGNLDAGYISQYFYADGDGKICAGPVWDYDITMGNPANWQLDAPNMFFAGRPHLKEETDESWYYALSRKEEFHTRLVQLYESEFRPLLIRFLQEGVSEYARETAQASRLNYLRWGGRDPEEEIRNLHAYMNARLEFLDGVWLEKAQLYTVQVRIREHVMACYAFRAGETMPRLPVPAGNEFIFYHSWNDYETKEPFDFSQPITRDVSLYLLETNAYDLGQNPGGGGGLSAVIKYVPLAVLCLLLPSVVLTDWYRRRKGSYPANHDLLISAAGRQKGTET